MKMTVMLVGWILADLIWWRWADRALRRARWAILWRILLAAFTAAQLIYVVIFLVMFVLVAEWTWPLPWAVMAYLWHFGCVTGTLLVLGIWTMAKRIRLGPAPKPQADDVAPPKDAVPGDTGREGTRLTRREAFKAVAVAVPPLATGILTSRALDALGEFRVQDLELTLPTLPADLDGLTIAHVSDLHIGRFLPDGMIERVAEATNAMAADLVVCTGDLYDASCPSLAPGIDFMRRLDPRHGLVMIEGNHDQMRGADRFEQGMRDADMPLLLDEVRTFRVPGRATPVLLMGTAWGELKWGRDMDRHGREANMRFRDPTDEALAGAVTKLAARREAGAFPILLAHHPHALDPAAATGLPVVLAGHTHGGQLMLTKNIGVGPLRFKYWSGLYARGDSRLFVNNGVGSWFPLRANAPAEIVKLTLRRA